MSTNIRFKRSDIPGKVPSLDSIDLGELALNTADGKLFTKQEMTPPGGIAAIQKIVEIGAQAVPNVLYVAKNGDDSNDGKTLGSSFLTLKKALSIATPGTTIFLKSGEYIEDNPLRVPARVSVVGDNLRNTTVRPKNPTKDIFWVYNGAYIFCMNFKGHIAPSAAVCFPPDGSAGEIVTSPYTQAVTSITTTGTGMRVDGAVTTGLRSMVCDAFTQYNQGGIGIHMLNRGNTQLVSIFTICCDISFMCENGGFCSVNLSNSSFGNYGLVSRGASEPLYRGVVKKSAGRQITFKNLARRPNIGDGVLFANYNQRTCDRDNGLVVDSLAFDLLYEGTTQSTFAGLRYWAKDGITIPVDQKDQTVAAIEKARELANAAIVGTTAKRIVKDNFKIISGIVKEGPLSPALIVDADFDLAEPEFKELRKQVLDAKTRIEDDTLKFLKDNFPSVSFIQAKCRRDIGLLVQAVADDMIMGKDSVFSTFKSTKFAQVYRKTGADNSGNNLYIENDERLASIEAFKFVRDQFVPIVQENATLVTRANTLFAIVTDGLQNPGTPLAAPTFGANQDTPADAAVLVANLQANKDFVAAEVIDYLNKNWPSIVAYGYNNATCSRDIKLSIDGICYDIMYGGNSQTLDAAKRYYDYANALSVLKSSEEVPATIDAFGRTQLLSQRVVINDDITPSTATPQVKTGVDTTQTQIARLGVLFGLFLKQLERDIVGTSDFIYPNGTKTVDPELLTAADALQSAKQSIRDNVISYLNVAYPGFEYDKVKCSRDVGYIVDSVTFDLLHGGNRQSITAGIYYFDFNEEVNVLKSVIPTQIKQTVNAYKYMKELLRDVLTCEPTPNPWQGTVPQVANLPAATSAEVVAVGNLIDEINEILQEGPNNAEDSIQRMKQPISLVASTDANKVNAFNLLLANRQFIQAEMLAYINQNWYTISDGDTQFAAVRTATELTLGTTTTGYPTVTYQPASLKAIRDAVLAAKEEIKTETIRFMANSFFDNFSFNKPKCYRDVGLILDAIWSDMVFGTANYKTVNAAISYLRAYASEVVGAQKVQTVASLKAAKAITLDRVVNPTAKDEISTRFDIVIDILNGATGPGVTTATIPALSYPIPSRRSEEDIDRYAAVTVLRQNIDFIKEEVVAYIESNFTLDEYNRELCARDTGLLVDAITYDMVFGSNFRSITAGRSYLRGAAVKVTGNQKLATVGAFKFLRDQMIKLVAKNSLAVNSIQNCMEAILSILEDGIEAAPAIKLPFPAKGRLIEYKRARDLVSKNREFIIEEVSTYINTPALERIKGTIATAYVNGTQTFRLDGTFKQTITGYDATTNPANDIKVGDLVRISGNLFGNMKISGYSSPTTYKVAEVGALTPGGTIATREFRLVNMDGTAILTAPASNTVGLTTGMRFDLVRANSSTTVTAINTGTDVITVANGSWMFVGMPIKFAAAVGNASADTVYYVKTVSTNDITISTTSDRSVWTTFNLTGSLTGTPTVSSDYYNVPTNYNVEKCRRDLGYILDAISYDLTYGGTVESKVAADSYFSGLTSQLDPIGTNADEVAASIRAYSYMKEMLVDVAQDITWSAVVGNNVAQTRSPNGSDGSANAAKEIQACMDQILDALNKTNVQQVTLPSLAWVDDEMVAAFDILQAAKEDLKVEVTEHVDENYVLFGYNREKCQRDVKYVVDAVRYDMMFGSNFRSIVAGRSYYRAIASTVVKDQKKATLESFKFLKTKLLEIVKPLNADNPTTAETTAVTRVTQSMDLILDILENGPGAIPAFVRPNPTGGTGNAYVADRRNARDLIEANREFIKKEIEAYIATTAVANTYNKVKCRNDLDYILDALYFDLTYGGNEEIRVAARAYYDGATLGSGELAVTKVAYQRLAELVEVLAEDAATPTYNTNAFYSNPATSPARVRSSTNGGTITKATDAGAANDLITDIYTYLNNVDATADNDNTVAARSQDLSWVDVNIRAFNDKFDTDKKNALALAVSDYVDANFAYSRAKCSRDVGFLIDALCYDLLYGGNINTTQAAISYFDGAVTPKSVIPKQIIQTVAAYERMKEVIGQVVELKDVMNSSSKFTAKNRVTDNMNLITRIIRDGLGAVPARPYTMPLPKSGSGTSAVKEYLDVRNNIAANREYIKDLATNFVAIVYPDLVYDKAKCRRDIDLVIDGVLYDLTYGGSYATRLAANSFFPLAQTLNLPNPDQDAATAAMFTYIAGLIDEVGRSQLRDRVDSSVTTLSGVTVVNTSGRFNSSTSLTNGDYVVVSGAFGTTAGDGRIVVPDTTDVPTTRPAITLPAVFKVKSVGTDGAGNFELEYLVNTVEGNKAVTTVVGTIDTVGTGVVFVKVPAAGSIVGGFAPVLGTPVIETTASGQAATLIGIVSTAISTATAPALNTGKPSITWVDSDLQTVVNAFDGIKTAVKTANTAMLNDMFPALDYENTLASTGNTTLKVECEQDIDTVFEAIKFDVAFGSNYLSQLSGKAYYRNITGTQNVLANQKDASIATFELVRDKLIDLVAAFTYTQVKTGQAGTTTAGDFAKARIDEIVTTLTNNNGTVPSTLSDDIDWVDVDLRTLGADITSAETATKTAITTYLQNKFVATGVFTYDITDCEADIVDVMQAIKYDMMFDSNFRTITAAKAYYRAQASKVIGEQKVATLEAFTVLKEKLLAIVDTSDVAKARVTALMDTFLNILNKGLSVVPKFKFSSPTGYNVDFKATFGWARNLVENNREFIKSEMLRYIYTDTLNNNISGSVLQFDEVKCLRDVDFILDSLFYDMTYATNRATLISARAYYAGSADATGSLPADDLAATVRAYTHLGVIVKRIAQGDDVTDIQTIVPQTFGDPGSVAASQTAKSLAFVIRNLINSVGKYAVTAPTKVTPSVTWVPTSLRTAGDIIETYKTSDTTISPARTSVPAQLTAWFFDQQTAANPAGGDRATWFVQDAGASKVETASIVKGKRYRVKVVGSGFSWPSVGALAQVDYTFVATANAALTDGAEAYEMFNYDTAKCERDIGLVMDAIRYDMMFDTNFRTKTAALSYWRAQAKQALANANQNPSLFSYGQKAQSLALFNQLKVVLAQNIGVTDITAQARINTLMTHITDMFDPAVTTITLAKAKLPATQLPLPTGGTNNSRDVGFLDARNLIELNRGFIKAEVLAWIDEQKRNNRFGFERTTTNFAFNRVECAEDLDLILDAIYYDLTYGGNMESYVAGQAYYAGATGLGGGALDSLPADEREATIRAYNQLGLILADVAVSKAVVQSQTALQQVKGTSGGPETVRTLGLLMDIVLGVVKGGVKQVPPKVEPDFMGGDETLAYVRMALNEQKFRLQADIADYIDSFVLQYNTEKCARDVGLILDAAMYDLVLGSNFQSITAGSVYSQKAAKVVTSTQIGPQLEAIKFIRDYVIEVSQRPPLSKNDYAIGQITQLFDLMYDIVDKTDAVAPSVVNIPPLGAALNPNAVKAANIIIANKEFLKEEAVAYITANYKTYDQSRCARDVGLIIEAVMYDLMLNTKYSSTKAAMAYRRATSSLVLTDQLPETLAAIDYVKERVVQLISDGAAAADVTASFELISNIIGGGSIPATRIPTPGGSAYTLPRPSGMIARNPAFKAAADAIAAAKATIISDTIAWIGSQVSSATTGSIWSGFTYTQAKCEEDVGFILDALRYDLTFGGNMETLVAGRAYYSGTAFANAGEVPATIATYTWLAERVASAITGTEQKDEARKLILGVRNLIDSSVNAVATERLPDQLWVDSLRQEISTVFASETPGLQDVIIDYVNNIANYTSETTPAGYDEAKCRRDVGLVLDAIRYDQMFGTTFRTVSAARSYRRAIATSGAITGAQAAANKLAFRELKERVVGKSLSGVTIATPLLKTVSILASGVIEAAVPLSGNTNYILVDDQITVAGTQTGTGAITNGTYWVTAVTYPTATTVQATLSATQGGSAISTTAGTAVGLTFTGNWDGRFLCANTTTVDNTPLSVGQRIRVSGTYAEALRTTDFRGLSLAGYSNLASQPKDYYVIATNGTTRFTLSATVGGAAIAVTTGITTNAGVETPNNTATTGLTFETRTSLSVLDSVITQGLLDTVTVTPNNLQAGVMYKIVNDGTTNVTGENMVTGGRYRVKTTGTSDYSTVGAHSNTVDVEFVKNSTPLTGNGTATYITDFRQVGALNNTAGTVFVATGSLAQGTMGSGTVETVSIRENVVRLFDLFLGILDNDSTKITALGFHNDPSANIPARTGGKTISAQNIVSGRMYRIATLGDTTWQASFGVGDAFPISPVPDPTGVQHSVGQVFVANANGSGASGTGTVVELNHYVFKEGFYSPAQTSATTSAATGNLTLANVVSGRIYEIATVGTSTTANFTGLGAGAGTVGTQFVATANGTATGLGTGTVKDITYKKAVEYINANRQFIEDEVLEWIDQQVTATNGNFTAAFGASFSSGDKTKCRRDVQFLLDAITFDLTFGGNLESIVAGKAYYGGTEIPTDVLQTIDAYKFLGDLVKKVVTGDAYTTLQATPSRAYAPGALDATGTASTALKAAAGTLVTEIISFFDKKAADPVEIPADTSWVESELVTFSDKLKAEAQNVAKATTDYINANFPALAGNYNVATCQRDVRLVIDAVRWDMMFNSNFRTIIAARSYYRKQVLNGTFTSGSGGSGSQKPATIAAFGVVKVALDEIVKSDLVAQARVAALMDVLLGILNCADITAVNTYISSTVGGFKLTLGTTPNAYDPGYLNARNRIEENRDFIVAQVMAYVAKNAGVAYDKAKCARDVELILDGLLYDLTYGGNMESIVAAQAYYLHNSVADQLPAGQVSATTAAFTELKAIVAAVAVNTAVTLTTYASTSVTATTVTSNLLTATTTAWMSVGMPVRFTGTTFGGVSTGTTYYVLTVNSATQFTVGTSAAGSAVNLSTDTGTMTVTQYVPQITSNVAGSAAAATQAQALVDIAIDYLDGTVNASSAEVKPSVGWVDNNLTLFASTMADSKDSLALQVSDYVTTTFPDLQYNVTTCQRDVKLIVDAVRYDMMFGTNFRSLTAGRAYYRGVVLSGQFTTGQGGTGTQKPATIAAMKYLKGLLAAIVANNATANARVKNAMNVVIDTLEFSPTTRNAYRPGFADAVTVIENARAAYKTSMTTYLSGQSLVDGVNFSTNYSLQTCLRDVEYVLDALKFDLTYGGNMESLVAGTSYLNGVVLEGGGSPNTHATATKDAFLHLAKLIRSTVGITKSAGERVDSLIADINAAIDSAASVSEVPADVSWVENEVQEVSVSIRAQKANIVAQVLDYVVDKFPSLAGVYNASGKCARDTEYVIEAVIWDMLLNSNFRSIIAGRSYARLATLPANEKPATLAAFSYLKELLQAIAGGGVVSATNYQSGRYNPTTGLGRALAFERITENMDIVLEILQNGIGAKVDNDLAADEIDASTFPLNAVTASRTDKEKAVAILMANKTFLAEQVREWIDANLNSYEYPEASCIRDVDLIVRSVGLDMVTGGDYNTITAGFAYLRGSASEVNVAKQKHITILAMRYLRYLMINYVKSTSATAATNVKTLMDKIINIVYKGLNNGNPVVTYAVNFGSDASIKPVQVANTAGQTLAAAMITAATDLQANRTAIINAAITASGNSGGATPAKCQRDTGYVIDALTHDLRYGGNYATVLAAKSYYDKDGTTLQLTQGAGLAAEKAATILAFNNLKVSTDTYITNTDVRARLDALVDALVNVVTNGPSVAPAVEYPQLFGADNALEAARNVLLSNIESAKTKVIREVNDKAYFVYDSVTCERDLGYIFDAIFTDVVTGSNVLSLQAGRSYANPGVTSIADAVKPSQRFAIISGLLYAKKFLTNLVSTNATIVDRIRNRINLVIDIINDQTSTYVSSADVPTTEVTLQANSASIGVLLDATKRTAVIDAAVTASGNSGGSSAATCRRDVGYILDSIAHDLAYGGTWATRVSARSYYFGNSLVLDQVGEKAATLSAINSLTVSIPLQTGWNSADNARLTTLVGIVQAVLNGPDDAADLATAQGYYTNTVGVNQAGSNVPFLAGASTAAANAKATLVAAKDDALYATLDAINDRPYLDRDFADKCRSDVVEILRAVLWDWALGTTWKSIVAGRAYLRSYTKTVTQEQKAATIGALYFIKKTLSDGLAAAASGSVSSVRAKMDVIIDILDRGVEAVPVATLTNPVNPIITSADTDTSNAINGLLINKPFLKAEIRAYIDKFYPNLDYDKIKCERDVDYIIDALRYDLAYGGNSETREAGSAYWEGTNITLGVTPTGLGVGEDEKPATVDAYARLATLVQQIIKGAGNTGATVATNGALIVPVQTIVSPAQVTIATQANANTIGGTANTLITKVKEIVNAANKAAADTLIDKGTASDYDYSTGTYDLPTVAGSATKTYFESLITIGNLAANTKLPYLTTQEVNKAFIDTTGTWSANSATAVQYFVYNKQKCMRDIGYIVDSLAFDLLFGGNKELRESGLQYAYKGGLVIPFATKVPTYKSTEYLASIIGDIILGTSVTKINVGNQPANQDTSNAAGAAVTSTLAGVTYTPQQLINNHVTAVLKGGASAAPAKVEPSFTSAKAGYAAIRDAALDATTEIAADTITFVNENFAGFGYLQDTCKRDIGLTCDALAYDLTYGGNSRTKYAAEQYFSGGRLQIPADSKSATVACFNHLDFLVRKVIRNEPVVTQQDYVDQDFSGAPATAAEVTSVAGLFDAFTDILANGYISVIELDASFKSSLDDNTYATFHQVSTITTTGHTLEWVGTGIDVDSALPYNGGVPKPENEIVSERGGFINFTSTDHKGDFRIGPDLTIKRDSGSIVGRAFNKSLLGVITPYILALQG